MVENEVAVRHYVGKVDKDGLQQCKGCGYIIYERDSLGQKNFDGFKPGPVFEKQGGWSVSETCSGPYIVCINILNCYRNTYYGGKTAFGGYSLSGKVLDCDPRVSASTADGRPI